MPSRIEVDGKTYSLEIVEVLAGKKGAKKVNKTLLPILEAIDRPGDLPFLIKDINNLKATDELRLALVRVQVHSELNMHEDLNRYQKRLYTVQTIEKLLFGEMLLEGGKNKGKGDKGEGKGKGKGK